MSATEEQIFGLDQADAWRQALDGVAHGYWHRPEACRALGTPAWLYVLRDGATGHRALCLFAERRWGDTVDIFNPAGFSGFVSNGPIPELRQHWLRFVEARGYVCGYFALHPVLADRSAHAGLQEQGELYVLDARGGARGLLDAADTNVQRTLRAWQRSGRGYVEDRAQLADFLARHYTDFMRGRNAASRSLWNEGTLRALCADPAVLTVGIEDELGLCFVAAFATGSHGAEYLLGVSIRDGRRVTAPAIAWGVERLCELRLEWLNLGGGIRPHDSVAEAKLRYRPRRLPFYAAREVYDQNRYRQLCLAAGLSGEGSDEGYFPRFRQPTGRAGSTDGSEAG